MSYQSEAQLEQQLIDQLKGQEYQEVAIPDYDSLVANFRVQFEKFNAAKLVKPLSDKESNSIKENSAPSFGLWQTHYVEIWKPMSSRTISLE